VRSVGARGAAVTVTQQALEPRMGAAILEEARLVG